MHAARQNLPLRVGRHHASPGLVFKVASKFKTRYAQFGFEDAAQLDDGTLWPTVYGITDITEAAAATISARVKKAVG